MLQIAIAGDLHDQWDHSDHGVLEAVRPDALLVVGDLSDGRTRIPGLLRQLRLPLACVLGNHDTGRDSSGGRLRHQLDLLGEIHCGWSLRTLSPPGLAVVGGRPATAGGGHHLSQAATAVFGPVDLEDSASRIERAALAADPLLPLVLLAHCGPTGLGSEARDPCGRDWKRQACDWGDHDLALALERIRARRPVPLVVFGHMHHTLRRQQGERITFLRDRRGTAYLNAACVPRHGEDQHGRALRHFSWIHLSSEGLQRAAHRWYGLGGELLYEELLWAAGPGDPGLAPPQPQVRVALSSDPRLARSGLVRSGAQGPGASGSRDSESPLPGAGSSGPAGLASLAPRPMPPEPQAPESLGRESRELVGAVSEAKLSGVRALTTASPAAPRPPGPQRPAAASAGTPLPPKRPTTVAVAPSSTATPAVAAAIVRPAEPPVLERC